MVPSYVCNRLGKTLRWAQAVTCGQVSGHADANERDKRRTASIFEARKTKKSYQQPHGDRIQVISLIDLVA
jgi:hypothetical protein